MLNGKYLFAHNKDDERIRQHVLIGGTMAMPRVHQEYVVRFRVTGPMSANGKNIFCVFRSKAMVRTPARSSRFRANHLFHSSSFLRFKDQDRRSLFLCGGSRHV
jgi:hypothetical protein